jgi:probable rRNA maturation factor
MAVTVRYEGQGRTPLACIIVRRAAERMLRSLKLEQAELSILLCDDEVIQRLNRDYRRKNRPTDVLAFAMREGEAVVGDSEVLGDVVISLTTSSRQAEERDRTLQQEVELLLAHGLLHLLGYDHRTAAEARRMNARADMLLAAARSGRRRAS